MSTGTLLGLLFIVVIGAIVVRELARFARKEPTDQRRDDGPIQTRRGDR